MGFPQPTRREILYGCGGVGGGIAGATVGDTLLTKLRVAYHKWDFNVRSAIVEPKSVQPGEECAITAQIGNSGNSVGSVRATLGVKLPDGRRYPASKVIYDIKPGKSKPVTLRFSAPIPADRTNYDLTIDLWTPNGEHQFDTWGWERTITVSPAYTNADIRNSIALARFKKGLLWGDWGDVHEVPGSKSITYLGGWLASSSVHPLDVIADYRDCKVKNKNNLYNALDCGGLILSGAGSLLTFGALLNPKVGLLGVTIDLYEDISDLGRIVKKFLKPKAVRLYDTALYLQSVFGRPTTRKVFDAIDDTSLGKALNQALDARWRVTDAVSTKREVVFTNARMHSDKLQSDLPKYFTSEQKMKQVLRNADHVYQGTLPNGERIRFYILETAGKRDYVLKVVDYKTLKKKSDWRWHVDTPWRFSEQGWRNMVNKLHLEPVKKSKSSSTSRSSGSLRQPSVTSPIRSTSFSSN